MLIFLSIPLVSKANEPSTLNPKVPSKQQAIEQKKHENKEEKKVVHFDKAVVKQFLMNKEHYSEWDADYVIAIELPVIDANLQPLLDAYLTDQTIDSNVNVQGITMEIIMKKYQCDFWRALIHMTDFILHPEDLVIVKNPDFIPWMAGRQE